ncbi:MAG: IS1595 family transposase [Rhizobiales bacterium]|nr:IS1595 family transposase [Hyphomicrobiales bacterium]
MSLMSQKHLQDEEAAYAWVEAHLWPHGPVCPHCNEKERISKMQGKATRIGLYKCYRCRKQFRVTVNTIFEKSHVPLHLWLQAFYLIVGSKKGISSNQLHRTLGVTLKTAWFMSHRIREAMRQNSLSPPMGGAGGPVEVDETYIGKTQFPKPRGGFQHMRTVLTLVDRSSGEARSFHVDRADAVTVLPIVRYNIDREVTIMTDQAGHYKPLKKQGRKHESVNHAQEEWVRGEVHTNTVEGYFSLFKRGMRGIYQHCSEKHLRRYLAEFDFRYSNRVALGIDDKQRAAIALVGVKNKRLTYRTTSGAGSGA